MLMKNLQSAVTATRRLLTKHPVAMGSLVALLLVIILALVFIGSSNGQSDTAGTGGQQTNADEHAGHNPQEHEQAISAEAASKGIDGQDPASQRQISLASAASSPNSGSQRGDSPAAGVSGGNNRVNPDDVLGDRQANGASSGGCAIGYGKPGEQCVPARGPGGNPATCADVRREFPNGVAVTGNDQLKLDRNNDKVACGQGE